MQSENEFLKEYKITDYPRPSVTADIAAFTVRALPDSNYRQDPVHSLSLLLIKRGGHPYLGHWALPGGFLNPGETIEACALREITEETNVTPAALMPVGVFSEPGRDPRGWVISHAFTCVISEETINERGGDDAVDAKWFDIEFEKKEDGLYRLTLVNGGEKLSAVLRKTSGLFGNSRFEIIDSGLLAFDHASIIATAVSALRSVARNIDILFDFLPEKFTLTSLQKVQETVMNTSLLPANFRRKIADYVEETGEQTSGAGHRPAMLYRKKQ
ncbi:MAG: NUDIX hydrolase [Clostridia bacterium]|jgi:ADP-ribose pyrophosphatase YjhB (NUDIX family)|nr:NUDIX hydrolase [Clostridia bacterium]